MCHLVTAAREKTRTTGGIITGGALLFHTCLVTGPFPCYFVAVRLTCVPATALCSVPSDAHHYADLAILECTRARIRMLCWRLVTGLGGAAQVCACRQPAATFAAGVPCRVTVEARLAPGGACVA